MNKEPLDTDYFKIWFDDGILKGIYKPVYLDLEAVRKCVEDRLHYGESIGQYPSMADVSQVKGISREARNFFNSERSIEQLTASAVIVNSKMSRMLGNFFFSINKPKLPAKLFNTWEEGESWIKQFVKE